jgi:hypothetical protein
MAVVLYVDRVRRLAGLLVIAACGDGGTAVPDARAADAAIDASPVYPACREFDGLSATVPVHLVGTLSAPDVQSPAQCTAIDAPYGVESAGPDTVVRIDGLTPGSAYVVQLASAADLGFYVVTGCSTPTGPSQSECMLFVDASAGTEEVGRFVAKGPSAYVVVDYYASHTPANQTFTLDVYAETCSTGAQCSPSAPVCRRGKCVECASSFDCKSAQLPRCDTTAAACVGGVAGCTTDDAVEPADDGPAGARALVLDDSGGATATGEVCSFPRSEADFYKLEVSSPGETWDFSLAWTGTRDLDLEVFDATGVAIALSYWEQPETARVTYLAPGTYYVKVTDFSAQTAVSVDYTLTAQRTPGTGCTSRADCASEYRNQVWRGACVAGACVRIDGAGLVAEGGACDSRSDCGSGLACPSFFFTADADTRAVCARTCTSDSACAPLGASYVCTTYLITNFCVQKCTSDAQCPTSLDSRPTSGPWYRLRCDVASGRCVP